MSSVRKKNQTLNKNLIKLIKQLLVKREPHYDLYFKKYRNFNGKLSENQNIY